jgi:hypothetical protein
MGKRHAPKYHLMRPEERVNAMLADMDKLYKKNKNRFARHSKRKDRLLPIRKVIENEIFRRHEIWLERISYLDDHGLYREMRTLKNYKQWQTK